MGGLSKTMVGGKGEFTIHVPKEYDYRFISSPEKREEIIDLLKHRYAELNA